MCGIAKYKDSGKVCKINLKVCDSLAAHPARLSPCDSWDTLQPSALDKQNKMNA